MDKLLSPRYASQNIKFSSVCQIFIKIQIQFNKNATLVSFTSSFLLADNKLNSDINLLLDRLRLVTFLLITKHKECFINNFH